jgi:2-oxoglutarate ferredoxin oxidoreductase subunit beta
LKNGQITPFETLDLCLLALESGCNFVARSYVGDPKQLVPLIQAALQHDGMAFIDVISPCVTFNNHDSSTKSYAHLKKHEKSFQDLEFVADAEAPSCADQDVHEVRFGACDKLIVRRMNPDYKGLFDRTEAIRCIHESHKNEEILTGLFYHNEKNLSMAERLNMTARPLCSLQENDLRPSLHAFKNIVSKFK